jgi:acetolactate synthase-1/2/3 large subunit
MPGPVLTRVVVSYEGREIRWLSALKSTYIDRLPTDQKVRMAARIGVRTVGRRPDDD